MKRLIGIYLRVSTKRQALVLEGSLKNQRQLVHAFIQSKIAQAKAFSGATDGGEWVIVEEYLEEPRTAKEASRRTEYQRLIADLKSGRINTIIILALSRFSRSMSDFLGVIKILDEKDADIISLRESLDTTSPQGRFAIKILISVNELEVEIDSERMVDSIRARSERGLWVGGQILGYDLDSTRPGHLKINERESKVVLWLYDRFLEEGSIPAVVRAANSAGFRAKEYLSRRGIMHEGGELTFSTVKRILTSRAYLGEAELNKRVLDRKPRNRRDREARYRVVPAVWPAIVPAAKFEAVQKLLAANLKTKHYSVKQQGHAFVFTGGLLRCDRTPGVGQSEGMCGGEMKGVTGTGKKGGVYPYYRCGQCGFRIPARQVEDLVKWRLRHLVGAEGKLDALVKSTNARLNLERPRIEEQRASLRKAIEEINGRAEAVIRQCLDAVSGDAQKFVQEKLDSLMERRAQAQQGLDALEAMAKDLDREMVRKEDVMKKLTDFDVVFEAIPIYKRRELVKTMVGVVRLSEVRMAVGLAGNPCAAFQGPEMGPDESEPAPGRPGAGSFGLKTGGANGIRTRDLCLDRAAC